MRFYLWTRRFIRAGDQTLSGVAESARKNGRFSSSSLHCKSLLQQQLAHTIAEVALELNLAVYDGAASPTRPLQVLAKLFQKDPVLRESGHDGHCLSAAPFRLQSQLGDDSIGDGFVVGLRTAFTIVSWPAAPGAHAPKVGGIHEPALLMRLSSVVRLHGEWSSNSLPSDPTTIDSR